MSRLNFIYTVGYGNRTFADFLSLLKKYELEYVVDVRSVPYSKYNQDFLQALLREKLKENNIGYIFMGEQLGGRPDDEGCYVDGKVDYKLVAQADFYQAGIARLNKALEKQYKIVLMCSELKPESCHRSKLLGQTLDQNNIEVYHIDETGSVETQQAVINRLTNGQLSFWEQPLFSRKRYIKK